MEDSTNKLLAAMLISLTKLKRMQDFVY